MPFLCGIDEAGRGPLAGPVLAAAVILPSGYRNDAINDSKKLSEKKREELFDEIIDVALCYSIVPLSAIRIDEINILQATKLAMGLCARDIKSQVEQLSKESGTDSEVYFLVDGNIKIENPDTFKPIRSAEAVVKGDSKIKAIAAASILAKVYRDRMMKKYDDIYPEYQLKKHKGYPTKLHKEILNQKGLSPIHRQSFSF